jgi:hypothetical protein
VRASLFGKNGGFLVTDAYVVTERKTRARHQLDGGWECSQLVLADSAIHAVFPLVTDVTEGIGLVRPCQEVAAYLPVDQPSICVHVVAGHPSRVASVLHPSCAAGVGYVEHDPRVLSHVVCPRHAVAPFSSVLCLSARTLVQARLPVSFGRPLATCRAFVL